MLRVLSTYRYVHQPLGPTLLAEIAQAGIPAIEVFCSPAHFAYRSPQAVRELAAAIGEHRLQLHSLHSPTERDLAPGRESGVPISISDTERIRRLDAVDEVKRALEVAELLPFQYLVQHMGPGRQSADPRNRDAAFNSLEQLVIFAKQRGVTIALENTPSELGAPDSLQQFIKETHLNGVKLCFDIGHAHLGGDAGTAFEMMQDRIVTTHIHDNHGDKDEHLLPYEGTIDWDTALAKFAAMSQPLPIVLELKEQAAGAPVLDDVRSTFDKIEKNFDGKRASTVKP
ncbi:MAG TPA: sugar phosphate isomerase/epimerase family protein [Candidatus Limnocylindrales bacterium]|nr:sugar phosphate isomerase/epimerase family protein [Candidatus Limnocylindrales bacterium]